MAAPVTISPGLTQWELQAYVEQAAFSSGADKLALALGDGRIALIDIPGGEASFVKVHQGSCLGIAAHPAGGFLSGGDDGLLAYTSLDGTVSEVTRAKGQWLEHMAASRDGRTLAVAAGREVILLNLEVGSLANYGPHAGTVSGLALSPAGGVLAVTHTGGVTLWDLDSQGEPIKLDLRGMNLAPAFSPDGSYLAMGHQENAVHIIDLESRKVFGLAGLPAKPGRLDWSHDGRHLLHTGTKAVICWPVPECFQENPAPVAFSVQEEARMSALAANPRIPFAGAGFSDGTVLLAELKRFAAYPLEIVPGSPVSALCWSAQGLHMACGMEDGRAVLLDLGEMLQAG
ncbi:WD40 repeat domain-containing protein [Fundidesulfovibrio terrae]|uniref:WD40 repeat domain-containing protein n=1 Tax=Fundidesulfovibrio terrae TaxID=2922866 RepID=UPI001FB044D2|nr:WD40 repeat domain-containing protein [Fundidesulfovibrio terrae]